MISLSKFKDLLGDEASEMSNEEIESVRTHQYEMAELAFGIWASNKDLRTTTNKIFLKSQDEV
tara:strand:- start:94 stop:282 length:189 start_codon:yes stop_codon:yes gene_type:complete